MLDVVGICIAYTLGILWGLYLDVHLGVVSFFILLCIFLAIKFYEEARNLRFRWIYQKIDKKKFNICLIFAICFLFGIFYTDIRRKIFENSYETGMYYMQGEVLQKLEEGNYYNKYRFCNEEGKNFLLYISNEYEIEDNSIISFSGEFEKPAVQRNRGGFDYANYLYSQNIYGSIYIKDAENIEVLKTNNFHLITVIQKNIFEVLGRYLPQEQLGILLGMIIGNTFYISEEIEVAFQKSGITHLLAVSGSNVAYVILATKFIFQRVVGKSFSNWITIVMVVLFVLISGASPSVVRAGLMAIILILSEIFARQPNTYSAVATTAILILLYNPFIICDVGFILSFGGTLGILFFNRLIQNKINSKISNLAENKFFKIVIDMLSVPLAAQLFLLPIMCFYFNEISFISIFSNLIVGPFTGIITICGIAMYFLGNISFSIGKILSYSVYLLISLIIFVSKICSKVPFANILVPTPSILEIILYYLVIYQFFIKQENKRDYYILKLIIIILIITECLTLFLPRNYLEINMIDVGQGDSILIKTMNRKKLLIDGGGSENSDYDVGEKILIPYLLDNTNGYIECMIISHFHEDHAEGCLSVLEKLKVKQIIIGTQPKFTELYQEVLRIAKKKNIPIVTLTAGDYIFIDNVKISALYPSKDLEINNDLNNNSLVLKVDYAETSILLTGDIEKEAEKILLDKNIDVDILKIAHHGSNTSSTIEFLEKVTPRIAVIGVGENNKFGHPKDEIIERLNKFRSQNF